MRYALLTLALLVACIAPARANLTLVQFGSGQGASTVAAVGACTLTAATTSANAGYAHGSVFDSTSVYSGTSPTLTKIQAQGGANIDTLDGYTNTIAAATTTPSCAQWTADASNQNWVGFYSEFSGQASGAAFINAHSTVACASNTPCTSTSVTPSVVGTWLVATYTVENSDTTGTVAVTGGVNCTWTTPTRVSPATLIGQKTGAVGPVTVAVSYCGPQTTAAAITATFTYTGGTFVGTQAAIDVVALAPASYTPPGNAVTCPFWVVPCPMGGPQ